MLPIGPFWSISGVATAPGLSALQCCVVWVYGGCLWPSEQDYRARETSAQFSLLAACKTLARRLFGAILSRYTSARATSSRVTI